MNTAVRQGKTMKATGAHKAVFYKGTDGEIIKVNDKKVKIPSYLKGNNDPRSARGVVDKTVNSSPKKHTDSFVIDGKKIGAIKAPINWGPIYDFKTKNQSFLDVQKQLKLLGIKNNAFHLILFNPALQGVDPHDPNITPVQAMMVVQECQLNIFYYLREVIRIPEQGKVDTMFKLDRGTLAAVFCFIHDISFYLVKPRQTGKSVGICACLSWAFKFGVTNGQFMFAGNVDKTPKDNLKKMKTYLSALPPYMAKMGTETKDAFGRTIRKTNNVKSYVEPGAGNSAFVARCAISEAAAEEIGRGESHTQEFYDEAEFTSYIDIMVEVSGMAFNTASQNALKNGAHACRMYATTPGDLSDEKKCQRALKLVNNAVKWDEKKFYDDYANDIKGLKEEIDKKSSYRVVYIEYSYQQLGYGEDWFRWACGQVGHNAAKIRREILLQRFKGNSMSPFTETDIIELNEGVKKPVYTKTINKIYDLNFYVKPEEINTDRVHFISVDPSDGTGSDNYAMVIMDPYTMKTILEFKSPYMSPFDLSKLLQYIVKTWFKKPIIVVESNRNGITVMDCLKETWLKPFIYSSPKANALTNLTTEEYDDKGFVIKDQLMRRKYFGIKTVTDTRDVMMGLVVDAVRFKKDIVCTEYLVEDINNLILKNGRIEAAPKKHDDVVMAWAICLYTIYYGEQLERWGYRKGTLPTDVEEDDEFKQLKAVYNNPVVRQYFPTMYDFWMNVTSKEMKKAHEKKVSEQVRETYGNTMGFGVMESDIIDDLDISKRQDDAWKSSVMNRWMSMNK